jgi:hypothetical protein
MADNLVTASETSKGFGYWSTVEWLADNSRAAVLGANVVLVPNEGFRDYTEPIFPVGTAELFQYLKGNLPSTTPVEIAVDDAADFRELAVHADIFTVATILLKEVTAPVLVPLLVNFLRKRFGSRFPDAQVRASLIVDQCEGDRHKSVQISYDGPAPTFEATVKEALSRLPAPSISVGSPLPYSPDSTAPNKEK